MSPLRKTVRRLSLLKLPVAQRQRRYGDVRPEDAVENEDHHLGVLQLQVCRLRPERLDRPDRLVFWALASVSWAPRWCPGPRSHRTHSIQNVALAEWTKAFCGIAAAAAGEEARSGSASPRNGMFPIELLMPVVERSIWIKPRMSWPAIAVLKD
jgi:hypothetical protein